MSLVNQLHGATIRSAFALRYGSTAYGRHARFLELSQWRSWKDIQAIQSEKLGRLLRYAYAAVPFYRERFDRFGLHPDRIQDSADLRKLPVLTKNDLQQELPRLVSNRVARERLIVNHSGGSTGQPTRFYQDSNYKSWEQADMLRSYRMASYRLGSRWAFLWGSDYDAKAHRGYTGWLKDRVVFNLLWINTFDLSVPTLVEAAKKLAQWKPEILVAYVSSAVLLAQLVRERQIKGIGFRAIQTSAEVLTAPARQLIESTFECPVFDRYGCRELGNISHECDAHRGLHILAENNLVELLDAENKPVRSGAVGKIVVTNLNNYAMPFIRYDLGDLAVANDGLCSCGRGLPVMSAIQGRFSDVITSPSGKLLHGEFFSHLFYKIDGIQQFRVVQESRNDLQIQLVAGTNFQAAEVFAQVRHLIHQHGDAGFAIDFQVHDQLPPAPSGKFRFTVSKLPVDLGDYSREGDS